jgi:hypothetical protein
MQGLHILNGFDPSSVLHAFPSRTTTLRPLRETSTNPPCALRLQAADVLEGKVLKVQKELEELAVTAKMLVSDHSRREMYIKLRRDELNAKKAELSRQRKLCEAYEKKIRREEAVLGKGDEQRAAAKARIAGLEEELAAAQGEKEKERQAVASLHRERDVLNRSLIKVREPLSVRHPPPSPAILGPSFLINPDPWRYLFSRLAQSTRISSTKCACTKKSARICR